MGNLLKNTVGLGKDPIAQSFNLSLESIKLINKYVFN